MIAHLLASPLAWARPDPGVRQPDVSQPCEKSGASLRYVVLFDQGTGIDRVKREIERACGATVTYYRGIGVAVARSADPDFGARVGPARAFSGQKVRRESTSSTSATPQRARPRLRPTDPSTVNRADRTGEQWDMRMIRAEAARAVTAGSDDVVVGVLDSGIDAAHPELRSAVDDRDSVGCLSGKPNTAAKAWAPTTSVHGTHVAGTIAAAGDGAGITGVAPGVRLASIKVIGEGGYVDPEAVVCGLMWAAERRMTVTNSSYFVDPSSASCTEQEDFGVAREAIARAAEYATKAGTLHIAAATNEGVNLSATPDSGSPEESEGCQSLPASLRSVVGVSSVGPDGVKAGYSSFGLGVITVTAPGGEDRRCVLSTVPGGYTRMCGTSMATPHVTGVAALIASAHRDYGPAELRKALTTSARTLACPTDYDLAGDGRQDAYCRGYRAFNGFYGHGLVDALSAVAPGRRNADAEDGAERHRSSSAPMRRDVAQVPSIASATKYAKLPIIGAPKTPTERPRINSTP